MSGKLVRVMKVLSVIPFRHSLRFIFENLSKTGRTKKQLLSFVIDSGLVVFCLWCAFSLRSGYPYTDFYNIAYLVLVLPPVTVSIFAGLGVYRWVVRASSRRQFEQLVKGSIGSSVILLALLYLLAVTFAPRSVFMIYGVLLILSTVGMRIVWARIQNADVEKNGKPVVIYGAGIVGRQLVNLMRLSNEYRPEFFLDNDPALSGNQVSDLYVFNPTDPKINQLLKKYAVEEIIMAMPSIRGDRYAKLLSFIEHFSIPVKTVPPFQDIVSGKSSPDEIRTIQLEDLLGREPVKPDQKLLKRNLFGKRVLVTGAGGSIGSELCRQIIALGPECLILFDNSELSLYSIDQELEDLAAQHKVQFISCLGSVNDALRLDQVIANYKPHTVYHAAAYKHVPIVENNPIEGAKTNILGTRNLVLACERHDVRTFVMISTDKAVRPTNIMGATKRVAEIFVQGRASLPEQKMTMCMVRFGNVLGSSGSVIPLFKKQIAKGGPVTVTHPDMTRYFMLIPEAVTLVIQAGSMAKGGELFLLDMGSPVRILDLAKALIKLHGLKFIEEQNNKPLSGTSSIGEIEIRFTGIRGGEKLYEELLIDSDTLSTEHPKISKASESYIDSVKFESIYMTRIETALQSQDESILKEIFNDLVSGYQNRLEANQVTKTPMHATSH